jgi:hypothetical protein
MGVQKEEYRVCFSHYGQSAAHGAMFDIPCQMPYSARCIKVLYQHCEVSTGYSNSVARTLVVGMGQYLTLISVQLQPTVPRNGGLMVVDV